MKKGVKTQALILIDGLVHTIASFAASFTRDCRFTREAPPGIQKGCSQMFTNFTDFSYSKIRNQPGRNLAIEAMHQFHFRALAL